MGRPSLFFVLESMRSTLMELAATSYRADRFNQMLKWLAMIESRLEQLESENEKLRAEVGALKKETAVETRSGAGTKARNGRFTTLEGVLWRRGAHGYESLPYCPKCRVPLTLFPPKDPDVIRCRTCKFRPPFGPVDLKAIRKLLPGE